MGKQKEPIIIFGGSENHHHSHNQTNNTTVHEHRAPTDESIRILDEMYEKTVQRIIQQINVKSSVFEIESVFFEKNPVDALYKFYSVFYINGKQYQVKSEIDGSEFRQMVSQAQRADEFVGGILIKKIHKDFSEAIAMLLCEELITTEFYKEVTF